MKKLAMFVAAALLSSAMSFAQTNLALGGSATASSGTAASGNDGNNGTRWESEKNDDQWWLLDLGSVETFNTIQIRWEGAYSKSFTIDVSEDGKNYTNVVTVTDVTLAGFPNEQSYQFDAVDARYIKFTNIARATVYGVSFWEFRVFNLSESVLTSIDLTASATKAKVGTSVALTVQGKDQVGQAMDAGDYTLTCTPEDAGTFDGNNFTPTKAGTADIVAQSGDVKSKPVSLWAYSGDKIDIFSKWQSMVTPINDETKTGSMVGAFDNNMGSFWELHEVSGADEASRTYTCGFIVDFGSLWDVTGFTASYEGACPQDYSVVAIDNEGNETTLLDAHNNAGVHAYSEYYNVDAKNTRYIKWVCTKAATQYSVKIYDFSVYGENQQELADTEAPTDFTASVVEGSESLSSVDFNLSATDNVSSVITYEISYAPQGDDVIPTTVVASGKNGENTVYTLNGLNAGVTYDFSIVAKDASGNATDAIVLTATTKSITAAPDPTEDAANVKSIFSDTYGNADGFFHNPNWGQATISTLMEIEGNTTLSLANTNYQGLEFAIMDVNDMEYLHIDIYPISCNSLRITPIWRNAANTGNLAEIPYKMDGLTPNEWNSLDIPMSKFDSNDRNGLNNVYQIKFDEGNNNSYLIDNIYFAKSNEIDEEAPTWVKAEATTVADTKATLTLQADDNIKTATITYTVKNGDDVLATAKGQQGTETTVNLSGLEMETEYNLTIDAADAAGNVASTTLAFTTTAKQEIPTSGEDEIIVQNNVITTPQTLKYRWAWKQDENKNVTFTAAPVEGTEVTGLNPTANIQDWTSGGLSREVLNEITWENCNEGDVLKAICWWAVAGGRATSEMHSYTVVNNSTGIEAINADENAPVEYYDLGGRRIANPESGLYIRRQGSQVTKVIVK